MKEFVILVDTADNEVGTMEKLEAHEKGLLHRAFSVCIFNKNGEMLLQKRASHKYHSGGLWTNTCCSHPRHGEKTLDAAKRRLREEMGIECALKEVAQFVYRAPFENGLTEYEYDHVIFGTHEANPTLNKNEADDFRWATIESLKKDMAKAPASYTYWFKKLINEILPSLEK